MARSLSLHIGVNKVDSSTYGSTVTELRSAVKDAEDMKKIAEDLQYERSVLLRDSEATSTNVLEQLGRMSREIQPGGVAFVTYAGHGSQVPDNTGDEKKSGKDQTWVLYDRMLIDDELYAMWKRFAPGVTIYFVSDSCHSGSVGRFANIVASVANNQPQFMMRSRAIGVTEADEPIDRCLPPEAALAAYEKFETQITATQWTCGTRDFSDLTATVISFAACQDEETAGDGTNNGIFTGALKRIWNNGQFDGSCQEFLELIKGEVNLFQRPNFESFGISNNIVLQRKPFVVEPLSTRVAAGGNEFGENDFGGFAGGRALRSGRFGGNHDLGFGSGGGWDRDVNLQLTPQIRCVLDISPAIVASISPEHFDATIRDQIADDLSVTYRQVRLGVIATGAAANLPLPRAKSIGGTVTCDTGTGGCTGTISGSYSWP